MGHRTRIVAALLLALTAALGLAGPAEASGTVTVTVYGQGTVTAEGISCTQSGGPDCSEFYANVSYQECDPELKPPCHTVTEPPSVTFTAGPDTNGYVFSWWQGACSSATGRTCTIDVTSDTTVSARWADVQAPSVSLAGIPAYWTGAAQLLQATASDNAQVAQVQFVLDNAVLASDTSAPYQALVDTTALTDGKHTFSLRATDTSGNLGQDGAFVYIDNTAPSLSVTSGPGGDTYTTEDSETWTFSAADQTSGVAAADCSVTLAGTAPSWQPCSGGITSHTVSGLAEGSYSFKVRATDQVGLTTTRSRSFTVDDVPPSVTVLSGPAGTTLGPMQQEAWTYSLAGSFNPVAQCSIAPAGAAFTWGECSDQPGGVGGADGLHAATIQQPGDYVFRIRAVDDHAATSPVVKRSFTVDDTPAVTSVVSGPANGSYRKVNSVAFQLGSDDPDSTYECRLYLKDTTAPAFVPCAGGALTASALQQGTFFFEGRATNHLGNTDPTPVVRRFTVDSDPPQTSITKGPKGTITSMSTTKTFAFTFAADEAVKGYRCKLDGGTWQACDASDSFTVGRGFHTLQVKATDLAGNVDPTPATRSWTLAKG